MIEQALEDHLAVNRGRDSDEASMASYLAVMAGELARLAQQADMPMLAYFLLMAEQEAADLSKGGARA
jgi:hypothetical protein